MYINSHSKMLEVIEKVMGAGRMSIGLGDWTEVGGLTFPQTQKTLGPDEAFICENITIGPPVDELYIPQVRG